MDTVTFAFNAFERQPCCVFSVVLLLVSDIRNDALERLIPEREYAIVTLPAGPIRSTPEFAPPS